MITKNQLLINYTSYSFKRRMLDGAKSIICPGVTCGMYSILTAGSVANSDLENETVSQGNPAQPKRKRLVVCT
jgi:acetyltransferase-like isoleucine patch superfamily enzyme